MTRVEVIVILLTVSLFFLKIRINKSNRVKRISIDEVANLSLKEQKSLLRKERDKRNNLIVQYNNAGCWKGVVHKRFVPDFENRMEIKKCLRIMDENILSLEKAIYENKF